MRLEPSAPALFPRIRFFIAPAVALSKLNWLRCRAIDPLVRDLRALRVQSGPQVALDPAAQAVAKEHAAAGNLYQQVREACGVENKERT